MGDSASMMLQLMADQSDVVNFVFDVSKGQFQYVNAAFEMITDRKNAELLKDPKAFFKIIHKEDLKEIKAKLKFLPKKKTKSILNFRIIRPDKSERWIVVKVFPLIKGNKVQQIAGTAEDDTKRKTGMLSMEKITAWKDATLEVMTHDLRGPIGIVQMLATVISKKMPANTEIQELTTMIKEISRRNLDLIQALLSREMLDTAKIAISKERSDVVHEIRQAMDIYIKSQKNLEKHISYTHSHDQIHAEIDSLKFMQIINNLVSNALKFTPQNGKILVDLKKQDKTFLITVTDDGIGIPKKLHPVLFKKHTKAGRQGLEGEKSVGLGMWIVKSLTEGHGGKVWFESKVKKGTVFYVEIPLENRET